MQLTNTHTPSPKLKLKNAAGRLLTDPTSEHNQPLMLSIDDDDDDVCNDHDTDDSERLLIIAAQEHTRS